MFAPYSLPRAAASAVMVTAILLAASVSAADTPAGSDLRPGMLSDAWPASEVIGDTFVDRDGTAVGRVRDILLTRGGAIAGLLVHRQGRRGGDDYAVSWSQVSTTPGAITVRSRLGQEMLESQARVDADALARRGVVGADSVLGTPVILADTRRFGLVQDLLFDPRTDRLVGYAVGGTAGGPVALPFEGSTFEARDGAIHMPYDRRAVDRLPHWGKGRNGAQP